MANTLQVKTQEGDIERWKEAAWRARLSLSGWVREVLDAAVEQDSEAKVGGVGNLAGETTAGDVDRRVNPIIEGTEEHPAVFREDGRLVAGKQKTPEPGPIRPPLPPGVVPASEVPAGRRQVTYDRRAGFDQTRR